MGGAATNGRATPHHREQGETLVEVLIAVTLTGLLATMLLGGLRIVATSDSMQRVVGINTVVRADEANAIRAAAYVKCAAVSDYSSLAYTPPSGSTVTVDKVEYWTATSNPATFSVRTCNATLGQGNAAGDTGLQRVTFHVVTVRSGITYRRSRSVLKRFGGTYTEPPDDPPPGGKVCTISDPTQVDNTWVDEFLGQTNVNHGSSSSLNILYLAGSRRYSYLRFSLAPGAVCDEGGTLPAGASIKAARLRLYTYNIGGLPACGANSCWHALERVRAAWTANSLTWSNQPCPTGYGATCDPGGAAGTLFEHGTGALDWSPRYQYIESPALLSQVLAYYAAPLQNYGWVIKEACAITYGKACGDISPGFQFRSKTAAVNERPALELTYV